MAKGSSFQSHLEDELRDPEFAADYLASALEEGDEQFLTEALASVIKAHGATKVAEETGLARQALYKMISRGGNPSFKNITKLLDAVGLEWTIRPKKDAV
jgi:probable addiction module antidote protein